MAGLTATGSPPYHRYETGTSMMFRWVAPPWSTYWTPDPMAMDMRVPDHHQGHGPRAGYHGAGVRQRPMGPDAVLDEARRTTAADQRNCHQRHVQIRLSHAPLLVPIDGFFEWQDIFGTGKNK